MIIEHNGETFEDRIVELDNRKFKECKFIEARLVYHGIGSIQFENCLFDRCAFQFVGSAANTVAFLQSMAQHVPNVGVALLDGLKEGRFHTQPHSGDVPSESS